MNNLGLLAENNNNNNFICEAVGCYLKATTKVGVKVGPERTIFLFLCDNCKPKFHSASNQDVMESKTEVPSD
jgi:hypothetical protein